MQISARVCKVKLAMILVHIGKITCLCLLSKCLYAMFIVFRESIRQYVLDLLPNWLCRLLQISAKHCRLVSVPPLNLNKCDWHQIDTEHPQNGSGKLRLNFNIILLAIYTFLIVIQTIWLETSIYIVILKRLT